MAVEVKKWLIRNKRLRCGQDQEVVGKVVKEYDVQQTTTLEQTRGVVEEWQRGTTCNKNPGCRTHHRRAQGVAEEWFKNVRCATKS